MSSNLMLDTFIANATPDELRAVLRGTIAACPPAVASALTAEARRRLLQTKAGALPSPDELFAARTPGGPKVPAKALSNVLANIRALYGAGLGFSSLRVLAVVVRSTQGVRWDEGSKLENILASIDTDISQAIQSSREELDSGRVIDIDVARRAVSELRAAVKEAGRIWEAGGGGYPFEQGAIGLSFWKFQ